MGRNTCRGLSGWHRHALRERLHKRSWCLWHLAWLRPFDYRDGYIHGKRFSDRIRVQTSAGRLKWVCSLLCFPAFCLASA
ncbi:hypothetical protein BCAR13_80180 [Paraburkholderia caribensis]|nr:hypothetical protein BCAR13_80180 [Paraburkholderia caribensis]